MTPLLWPRVSRSRGSCSAVLFLAEECAGHLDYKDATRRLPCAERHPRLESPLDHLGTHQPDDRVAVFGCGELCALPLRVVREDRTFHVRWSWAMGHEAGSSPAGRLPSVLETQLVTSIVSGSEKPLLGSNTTYKSDAK